MTTTELDVDTEEMNSRDMEIDALRDVLREALDEAQDALRKATGAVTTLASARLYDIEYAESTTSSDLQHTLADAARAVRIALALQQQIESLPNNA